MSHGLHSHDHDDGPDRRDVLKLLGFSLGAATLASCTPIPERRALPLLSQPEGVLPGVETWYATACRGCSAGCGLLVKTRDGRPIKIEGNPDSFSGGGTCAVGQAAVLSLYDDQRLRGPLLHGRPAPWPEVDAFVRQRLEAVASHRGGIVLLTGTIASPSTRALIAGWQARFPGTHVVYDPVSLAALRQANGVLPHYHFDRARFVAGLEADFLGTWLSPVEFARAYVRARKQPDGLRHVQIESGLSLTGSNADRRIAVHPSELGLAALALLQRVAARAGSPLNLPPVQPPCDPCDPQRLDALADDLWRHQGESLVVCGLNDLSAQLAVHRINALLGNIGTTIDLDHPSWQRQGDDAAMAALLDDMERGAVHALVVWGANPAYDHPQADRFVRALANVSLKVSLADRLDETAVHADVVCPDHHFLESWGDGEPVAGRLTLMQPTIAPLFDTRAAHQTLLTWMGQPSDPLADLRERWRREVFPRQDRWGRFEDFWEHALEAGGWALTPDPSPGLSDRTDRSDRSDRSDLTGRERGAGGEGLFEVLLHETVALRDGRHANNPWLQELPDPVARTAWGNHVAVAPQLAAELGVEDGDVVALQRGENRLELPVLVQPGLPPRSVAVALGYGRTGAGKAGNGVGANAWPFVTVRDGFTQAFATGVQIEKTGRRETLAQTQTHSSMEGRPIVRETTLAALSQPGAEREADQSLWEERPAEGHSWGMVIDLDSCLGCAACVVSCQAENNIAVVGRDEIARGREMHWLRIDRYFNGPQDDPETVYQPMMCQHCANAPCETVCPVLATVHSSDGLNQQVYNRCVGTRYCANNCPYKVRRFNWFNYAGNDRFDFAMNSDLGRMVLNPDVVVRTRGVMEKCSLCIQRIQAGKLRAEADGVPLQDGAIRTACQQACPSEAITFGDAHDPASEVSRLRASPRFYRVLDELNTRPAVGYLARLRREA